MDFNGGGMLTSSSSSSTTNNNFNNNKIIHNDDEDHMMSMEDLRRGPWTLEEDHTLINHISIHGEGRWNSLATCAGLKRTGKSCRLRWLNYLRPDVRRGNITLEEQLLILELHSRWGNRWSKIAQHLPGRTDNEIKNYWRTRVQKHAKQLKCDVNSKQFKDTMRYLWMPRLVERINASASTMNLAGTISNNTGSQLLGHHHVDQQYVFNAQEEIINPRSYTTNHGEHSIGSSDSFGAQVSPVSDLTDNNNNFQVNNNYHGTNTLDEYFQGNQVGYMDTLISPSGYYNNLMHGFDFQAVENNNNNNNNNNSQWLADFGNVSDNLWNNDISFLQQQFTNSNMQ